MSVTYQHDRFSNGDRRHSNNKARLPHRLYFSQESRTTRRCDTGTNTCHRFLLWIPSTTTYDFRVMQLNNWNDFPPSFSCKMYSLFLHTLPIPQVRRKACVEYSIISVCSYSYLYYLREYKLCRCARTRITPPSRPGTQPLVMLMLGFFRRSNRNHYLLVVVMRALASSIHVRTCHRTSINKCTTMIPTAVPRGFFYQ